jgi:hypothetical protein
MKNLILLFLFVTACVSISAQQLYDGKYKWEAKQVELEVEFDIEQDGELITNLNFIIRKDTLKGDGYWVNAPRYSDMSGGGWYEATLENEVYLEMDSRVYGGEIEIKIIQNIQDVNMVVMAERVYKPCRH